MKQEKEQFLNLANFPGRVSAEQAGWISGFSDNRRDTGCAHVGSCSGLSRMGKATTAVSENWKEKNASRVKLDGVQNDAPIKSD